MLEKRLKLYLVVYYHSESKESWFETFKRLDEFEKRSVPYLGYVIFWKEDIEKARKKAKEILNSKKNILVIDITDK